ncbi:MAG: type II toxin-antitoxin system HicA family toxin [Acidobacteria bacterium]|nr:type II toxin-antitoxin system HicA family toxin [Acidobacteriota bacterium]
MTSSQFKKWLARQDCTFRPAKGGHLRVELGGRISHLPMHGSTKELGRGLVEAIKKQLDLKEK